MRTQETYYQRTSHGPEMKRGRNRSALFLLSLLVSSLILLGPSAAQAGVYSGGAGTEADPYRIGTVADWQELIEATGDWDKRFLLTADLDFVWAMLRPVARDMNPSDTDFQGTSFTGFFDGGGHFLRRLVVDTAGGNYAGVFGVVGFGGRIVNLHVEDATVVGYQRVGALVGECDYALILNCSSEATVEGGLDVGGLVGMAVYSQILNCCAHCVVRGAGDVGGLLGQNLIGVISFCRSEGEVSGQAGIGGLIGWDDFGVAANCSSSAAVEAKEIAGGLIGGHQGFVVNSYSVGVVRAQNFVGGLVGASSGSVLGGFWDITTSGQTVSDGGTGLTTEQMQSLRTFTDAGWDFVGEQANGICEVWQMPAATGYPELSIYSDYIPPRLEGDGTAANPYLLKTPADLVLVWRQPMASYRLEADLDLSGTKWLWAPIPLLGGRLDGQGHRITNLTFSSCGGFMGLIGCVATDAVVVNLGVEEVNLPGRRGTTKINGDSCVGCLAAVNQGTIASCYSMGVISGQRAVGGLVGFNCETGTVANCYSRARVSGDMGIGGLVGWNSAAVVNSYSTGYVDGAAKAGGLVGSYPIAGTGSVIVRSSVLNCFWDTTTSGMTESDGGTGVSTAHLRDINTFLDAGWDFVDETANGTEDVWKMPEWAKSYPALSWQKAPEMKYTTYDFESGDLTAAPWRTSGDVPWSIGTAEHYAGKMSAQSGAVGADQISTLEMTCHCAEGDISFALRVSTELGGDYLRFYIDGLEQAAWSGTVYWQKVSFPVPPGQHTFTWSYIKDMSSSGGRDTVWIDEVSVPTL